ncbi:hypothetical protein [Streptomyces sp. NPDC005476]|uniref:hypothetical protein n=1 Tax=Streptomyces sp. NPDC005476 TaxID=3156882 RepID=UPI00345236BB
MNQPTPVRSRPLVRGLAPRFALLICDPRVASALQVSCVEDVIDVHYPESDISCRLLLQRATGQLLCVFSVTHLAPDGSAEERHRMDLTLDGPLGSAAQREAVLDRIHAFRCAATASRVRVATRILGRASRPLSHSYLTAA